MATYPYEYYVDIVTKRYFHGVDNHDLQLTLACFHADAVLTEMTSNTVHEGRDTAIRAMFEGLFAAHSRIWHGNFVHTVDTDAASICSQFSVEVTPTDGAAGELRYENCNRFYLDAGRFKRVHVYMSGENLLR
ncbi:MAG: nuclear transport factor 2 family protein [Gammaproteobacteria bacterium]|nr:nuclear transport factor 2 family protein [Gammaproteobacteria bacterium]